mmetsp:Transcript_17307/g.70246  ORF Transcript_17307/g.70246 Transcript_17307/m.70246 type:complete len:97 (-) Transcript_17307:828-1118(-)
MMLLKMESVGHEESIVNLRAQWWKAHKELEKLQKQEKAARQAKSRKPVEPKNQQSQEAAQGQGKAGADAAAQPEGAADKPAEVVREGLPGDAPSNL